jgi:hypothetical protein
MGETRRDRDFPAHGLSFAAISAGREGRVVVILVNCPECKKRFSSNIKPPKQEKDQAAEVPIVCPDCKHEFHFRMSGFPVDE